MEYTIIDLTVNKIISSHKNLKQAEHKLKTLTNIYGRRYSICARFTSFQVLEVAW